MSLGFAYFVLQDHELYWPLGWHPRRSTPAALVETRSSRNSGQLRAIRTALGGWDGAGLTFGLKISAIRPRRELLAGNFGRTILWTTPAPSVRSYALILFRAAIRIT